MLSRVLPSGRRLPPWFTAAAAVAVAFAFAITVGTRRLDSREWDDIKQFVVYGEGGKPRVELSAVAPNADAAVTLYSADLLPEVAIGIWADGRKGLSLHDLRRGSSIRVNVTKQGDAMIAVDGAAKSSIALVALQGGATALQFWDKDKKVRIKLGLRADGSPEFVFFDDAGKGTSLIPPPRDGGPRTH